MLTRKTDAWEELRDPDKLVDELTDVYKNTDPPKTPPESINTIIVGKTEIDPCTVAKNFAADNKARFYSVTDPDLLYKTFNEAGLSKKKTVVFVEDIDKLGDGPAINLLMELDGTRTNLNRIIIGSAEKADSLDEAFTRAGRFSRILDIESI